MSISRSKNDGGFFKKFVRGFDPLGAVKDEIEKQAKFNDANSWAQMYQAFGYELSPDENIRDHAASGFNDPNFGLLHLESQYIQWKEENPKASYQDRNLMEQAFKGLRESAHTKDTMEKYMSSEALVRHEEGLRLWGLVARSLPDLEYDVEQAKDVFFSHCLGMTSKDEQTTLYNKMFVVEILNLYREHCERCDTLDQAYRFDAACKSLVQDTLGWLFRSDYVYYMVRPYSAILQEKLAEPSTASLGPEKQAVPVVPEIETPALPVVAEKTELLAQPQSQATPVVTETRQVRPQSQPEVVTAHNSPVFALPREVQSPTQAAAPNVTVNVQVNLPEKKKKKKKDKKLQSQITQKVAAPTLSDQPILVEMTIKEARVFLNLGETERFTRAELDFRYTKITDRNDSKVLQSEIDTAYEVLKAYLEAPQEEIVEAPALSEEPVSVEMTVDRARKVFDYAEDEIPKLKDLNRRYKQFVKKDLPEIIQEEIDEAYAVLLKIAA